MITKKISSQFSPKNKIGKLIEISAGVSDPHYHGKSVYILKFESKFRIVYKPKDLTLELAYSNLLSWFNKNGLSPDLKPLDVLNCGSYGWVGFVEAEYCTSLTQIEDYYRRVGMLIAIVYLLKGNDCHYENLIASGEYPVLIDLESIMHHTSINMLDESVESAIYQAYDQFGASVFRTGLLPTWNVGKDDYTFDISGIGAGDVHETPYKWIKWDSVNTDLMDIKYEPVVSTESVNMPKLNGKRYLPFDFEEEILEGFTNLYQHIINHKDQIPLESFADQNVRFIFRNTKVYALINKKLLNPKFMRFGIDRSIQLDLLCRAFLHKEGKSRFWGILKSEVEQMEDYDIPIFTSNSSGTDICSGSKHVMSGFMEEAVHDQVLARLELLDDDDLKKQLKYIKASLFFRNLNEAHGGNGQNKLASYKPGELKAPGKSTLVEAASNIADQIIEHAYKSDDGSATWITVGLIPGTEKLQMRPMSIGLYDGLSGVALFFGAMYKVTGDKIYCDYAKASLTSIQRSIDVMKKYQILLNLNPLGICIGLSSIMYTLMEMSDFLNDPTLINDAEFIAGKITPELIKKDNNFDMISGSAGTILALLKLFDLTNNNNFLQKAILCGKHLLDNKMVVGENMCGWQVMGDKLLAGFSHGNAGIAYSLMKLYHKSGERLFLDTAIEAIAYEDSLFRPENKNWEDLREALNPEDSRKQRFMTSWCHGSPGIALSRLAISGMCENEIFSRHIQSAIESTKDYPLNQVDHYCCGNMGRIEALLYASQVLNSKELKDHAYYNAAFVIDRFKATGQYVLFNNASENLFNPGFFQGISGIGYEFLRLAFPEKLPSILIFE